jgi:two-component system cell cycle response regulator
MTEQEEKSFFEVLQAEKQADQFIINTLEKKLFDLKNLIEIGISLSSNLEFHNLVESILYSCIGQLFLEKIAILLQKDIDVNCYYIHTYKGYEAADIPAGVIIEETSSIIDYFERKPIPQNYSDLINNDEISDEIKKLSLLDPVLIVPMKSRNTLNGLIIVGNKITGAGFEQEEKDFLRNLARFSATAVENSRLYQMATHDRMTRLYIHHYFQERLAEEIARSVRKGHPLTLLMCDIDHFKKFNDTYGHQQGDIVLKHTAKIIKQSVRAVDIPARYGGEEFAVILPETDGKSAVSVGERLRKMVENFQFPSKDKPLSVTISIGITEFNPEIDVENKHIIERADKALYISKKDGRNRVTFL